MKRTDIAANLLTTKCFFPNEMSKNPTDRTSSSVKGESESWKSGAEFENTVLEYGSRGQDMCHMNSFSTSSNISSLNDSS